MGKAGPLTTLVQRREFFIRFAATFAAIIGLASAALSITGSYFGASTAAGLVLLAMMISALIHLNKLIVPQVAVDDILTSNIDTDFRTTLHCPCSMNLSAEAKSLARSCFAGSFTIGPDTYEQLRAKNPNILACLTDHDGEFLGYFDVIPLKETFARAFLRGLVTEVQITHDDVLSPSEMSSTKYLFLSGLAVRGPNAPMGRRSASILVWALLKYLDNFYGATRALVFAVAAKDAGEDLLKRFRLALKTKGTERADKYDLYTIVLTPEEIAKRLACLPDWSKLCALSWTRAPKITRGRRPKNHRRPPLPKNRHWNLNSRGDPSMKSRTHVS